ncbi:TPA: hypothetical protein ACLAYU_000915, partial [Neisseria meningitidis]
PPPNGGGRCKKYGTAVCPFFVGRTPFRTGFDTPMRHFRIFRIWVGFSFYWERFLQVRRNFLKSIKIYASNCKILISAA